MTRSMTLYIPGTPVGKGRPRFAVRGRYVHAYTPDKTAEYEDLVREVWKTAGCRKIPEGVPIRAMVVAGFPIPKSKSKKLKAAMAAGEVPYLSKPDLDNIAKCVLDALNGSAYHDDSQIISLSVEKLYSEEPNCVVRLEWEVEDG